MIEPWFPTIHGKVRIACALTALFCVGSATAGADDAETRLQQARDTLGNLTAPPFARAEAEEVLRGLADDGHPVELRGKALVALGASKLFTEMDFSGAIRLFEQARATAPEGSEEWAEATYGLATAIHHRMPVTPDSVNRAQALFEQILKHDRESLLAARALLNVGRIHEVFDYDADKQNLNAARAAYQEILQRWPEELIAHEAAFRYGSTLIQEAYLPDLEKRTNYAWRLQRIQEGIDYLHDWVLRHPDNPLASGFWEYIGNSYMFLPEANKREDLALQAYLHATGDAHLLQGDNDPLPVKQNMDRVDPAYLYLKIAVLAQRTGHRFIALEYYGRLITEKESYRRGPLSALQLTANMGFSKEEVIEHARIQYADLGLEPEEIEHQVSRIAFPAPPEGGTFPTP